MSYVNAKRTTGSLKPHCTEESFSPEQACPRGLGCRFGAETRRLRFLP